MNKEYLEALRTIKIKCHPNSNPSPLVDEALDTVEKALQRLESIDNANPSDALELVGYLKDLHMNAVPYYNWLDEIEKYILKAQEQDKVLGILNPYLRLVDNFLQARVNFYDEVWLVIKEITDEEELELLKKILGQTQI